MGENSKIEWCDSTVNFWIGCTKVSAACDHCYAETLSKAKGWATWGHGEARYVTKNAVATAFKLERKAAKEGRPLFVFTNSLADMFDAEVPDEWRDRAFAVMALTPHLTWLVLTKRPKVMREYFSQPGRSAFIAHAANRLQPAALTEHNVVVSKSLLPLPNVWLGTTVEDQKMADLRIPDLLATPAAGRFVSMEPLLGATDLTRVCLVPHKPQRSGIHIDALRGRYAESGQPYIGEWDINGAMPTDWPALKLDWVIAGGESGPKARPSHPDWFRSLRDQCAAADVPFLFKQWGEWASAKGAPGHLPVGHVFDDGFQMMKLGKAAAGRLLDGVEHNDRPQP